MPSGSWVHFGETRGGVEKSGMCWSTKAAISPNCVEIEEKLLWRAYRNSPMLFRTVSSPTLNGLLFHKIGDSQPNPKTAIAIISGTGKATNFKFGGTIQKVHPNRKTH